MKTPEILRAEARAWLAERHDPTPRFELQIGWADGYTELFAEKLNTVTSSSAILPKAMSTGRVVIAGPGGSGKTIALLRTMKEALDGGALVAWVDFTQWSAADYDQWGRLASPSDRLSFLVRRHAHPLMSALDLNSAPSDMKRVVFFDGLNEIAQDVGQQVLLAIDDYAQIFPQSCAVVSDRLVRRDFLRADQWNLGRVLPLTDDEIEKHAPGAPHQLRLAFFLDTHIHERGDDFDTYFAKHCGLSDEEVGRAADAAYSAYARRRSRVFDLATFEVDAGRFATKKLLEAGSIKTGPEGGSYFEHHLVHDSLVGRFVATHHDQWASKMFNIATFDGSSVDVLPMVARRIPSSRVDVLIRKIYDWNLYAAGYLLAEASAQIPEPVAVSVLATLAERRFDRILSTAERASDAVLRVGSGLAKELANARLREDVSRIIGRFEFPDTRFREWKALFVLPSGAHAPDRLVANLDEEDSIIGWASSNVLKRMTLTARQESRIRDRLHARATVVRWRVVHALGGFPSRKNLDALLQVLEHDEDGLVRYGAQRSVVELALAAKPDLRVTAFERLQGIALERADRLTSAFARNLLVLDPPSDWRVVTIPVLLALRERERSEERREDVERVAYEIRRRYGVSN